MDCPRVPFAALSRACSAFAPSAKIGEGATGEVFRGSWQGAGVAIKRLHLPEGATPSARAALVRAFHAELATLSAYRHPRLVRLLCHAIDEDPASLHPFVLALELLEGGSLADHLRSPTGGAPLAPGPPLTPLERVDAALGAAAGLAYLHGLREGGEAGPAQAVLHRDVKAANIGLTRAGGGLYAKVLDCGLASALKGGAGGGGGEAAAGRSLTGGVVSTLGYMAPELAQGLYTPRSDIYALGCVLLELLSGVRVGPTTAGGLEEAAEEGAGAAGILACAEACWPQPAAQALAELTLACIQSRPKRRPESVGKVLEALRALRALLAPTGAAAAPLIRCPLACEEEVPEASGTRCPVGHFCCNGCLQEYVRGKLEVAVLRANEGRIPCYEAGQGCAHAWTVGALQEALDKGTHVAYSEALLRIFIDGPKEAAALAAAQAAALAAAAQLALGARVAELRRVIVERDLMLRCPHCAAAFDDYSGCNALTCGRCGTGFCAVCLKECGTARATHVHHREAHGEDYYNRPLFEREKRARYLARLCGAVAVAGGAEVQRALVAELGRADLRDLGISEAELLAGAGVGAVGGGATAAAELPTASMAPSKVVALMRFWGHNPRVAEEGARALVALTGGGGMRDARVTALKVLGIGYDARCKECIDLSAVATLVAALKSHAGDGAVVEQACCALRNIAAGDDCQGPCVEGDAVPALVAALMAHPSVAAVAVQACRALSSIAFIPAGKGAAVEAGAVPAIVAALMAHPNEAEVAENACLALLHIARIPAGEEAAVAAGAVPAVVAALKAHPSVAAVAEGACLVLWSLANISAGQEAAVAAGAVPALVAALKAHPSVAFVAEHACGALWNITDFSAGQEAAVAADAVPALVAALKAHSSNSDVAKRACGALANSAAIFSGKKAALSAGAVPAVVAALKAHPSVAAVAEEACGALRNIARNFTGKGAAVEAGAMPAVVAALKAHSSVAYVAEAACGALGFIAAIPAGPKAAMEADAVPAVVAALKAHPSVAFVARQACLALYTFGADSPSNQAAIVEAGAVPVLAAAFSALPDDARDEVHEALDLLGYSDDGAKK